MARIPVGWVLISTVAAGAVMAEPLVTNSYTLYGTPGLIEMPTAESAPDAELSITTAKFGNDFRNTLSFQMTPRLSGSFRYSKLPNFNLNTSTDRTDRSFDLRFRFLDESRYLPAMAVGLRDFIGTGVYSSEYVVATKSFGDKVRVTAGLGWGRMGSNNPVFSFGSRPSNVVLAGQGGQTNDQQWFRGDAAPFGGISWKVNDRLTVKAEYSSDAYIYETGKGLISPKSQVNYGLDYGFRNGVRVGASYSYGDRVGLQVTVPVNPKRAAAGPDNGPGPLPVAPRPSRASAPDAYALGWVNDGAKVATLRQSVQAAMAKDGLVLVAMATNGDTTEVHLDNRQFTSEAQSMGRTVRILSRAMPASVERFVIVPVEDGVPSARVTFLRRDVEQLENAPATAILQKADFADAAGAKSEALVYTPGLFPRFTWGLTPYVTTSFFDPDKPVRADMGIQFSARYDLAPGWMAEGSVHYRLTGNIGDGRTSNSRIQRVRTDGTLYARAEDGLVLDLATVNYFGRPGKNLYSRATIGYLERMYAGVSTELLWKPVDSKLAIGAELNYVKQRAFDGGLGFRNYEVLTGHASAYYDFGGGWKGQIDAGRYLAGDYGATIGLDRTFANGWKVGAFATFTDVSPTDFGEGSFDKGIRIEMPLAWAMGTATRTVASTNLRPTTRDGGARLIVRERLFERVEESHKRDVAQSWGRFWR